MNFVKQSGQTLVEVLIALGVIVVIVTSITIAVVNSLSNAEFVKNQNLATQYAQQGMEIARFMRNTQYGVFKSLSSDYCLADTCNVVESDPGQSDYVTCGPATGHGCDSPNLPSSNPTFVRKVRFDQTTSLCDNGVAGAVGVTSTVSWADNKCTSTSNAFCHQVKLFSCFSSGDVVPTPQ